LKARPLHETIPARTEAGMRRFKGDSLGCLDSTSGTDRLTETGAISIGEMGRRDKMLAASTADMVGRDGFSEAGEATSTLRDRIPLRMAAGNVGRVAFVA
jgi:hypothetical protein